jgi:hypothetical protein
VVVLRRGAVAIKQQAATVKTFGIGPQPDRRRSQFACVPIHLLSCIVKCNIISTQAESERPSVKPASRAAQVTISVSSVILPFLLQLRG